MAKQKQSWVRDNPPKELRHTVIVTKEKDPLLHSHIANLPFGQIGKEMRALMNMGLKTLLQERINEDIQGLVAMEVAPRTVSESRMSGQPGRVSSAQEDRLSMVRPASGVANQFVPQQRAPAAPASESLSPEDIARIEELDNLSL